MSKYLFYLSQLSRVLWVRASFFAVAAAGAALLAHEIGPHLPDSVVHSISDETVVDLLRIIASSMLAVATFSLTALLMAYGTVTNNAGPRAAALVLEKGSAQNALSIFVGAFIFSVVGLIAVGTGFYDDAPRFVLFVLMLGVLAVVVVKLLQWIDELSRLSQINAVIEQLEKVTRSALERHEPSLGARPREDAPDETLPIAADRLGYVQHVDVRRLDRLAQAHGLTLHVAAEPGSSALPTRPVLYVSAPPGGLTAELRQDLLNCVVVGDERTFHQDPRFGLVVLAQVASRALSPALNDPGTAIQVLGAATRLLSFWAERWEAPPAPRYQHVTVPVLSAADGFEDVFSPIARDGAKFVEVGIALQKSLYALSLARTAGFAEAAHRHAHLALSRAERAIGFEDELRRLRETAAERLNSSPHP